MRNGFIASSILVMGVLATSAFGCGDSGTDPEAPVLPPEGPLVVDTDKGKVEGWLLEKTRQFLGIPFAAPPIGDLRWKRPQPHAAWTETFVADTKGKMCTQGKAIGTGIETTSGEDCLTINVWTPERPTSDKLPVMVWIYGGGFEIGSGSDNMYDGRILSEQTGAVVVTFNYRLGPLGFLALPALAAEDKDHSSSGAYGLEDQRAALEWVKTNIASFSGDPTKVTLFGESAGGISTCAHIVSPPSKGLFQRAIIESGPCDSSISKADGEAQGAKYVEALGCTAAPDVLACLRGKTEEEALFALPSDGDFLFGNGANWYPVIDGYNLPDRQGKLLESGAFEKMPIIVGTNADEGSLFFALDNIQVPDEATFLSLIEKVVPGKSAEILAHYPIATYGDPKTALSTAVGDAGFICQTRRMARAFLKGGATPYLYHFTYAPPDSLLGPIGSFHAAEVKYVFGVPSLLSPQALNDDELTMSAAIQGYWSRFAAAGDPNGANAVAWPKYDAASDENIKIDVTITKDANLRKELCDWWDTIEVTIP